MKTQPSPSGHLALPRSGKGPGILVIHAWWGLNEFFKEFCDRLSEEGFVVLAPDLYGGVIAETVQQAKELRSKLRRAFATKQISESLESLVSHPRVKGKKLGIIGFSMGAYLGLGAALDRPEDVGAVVLFYGCKSGDFKGSQAAFLGHFAEDDEYVSQSSTRNLQNSLRKAGRDVSFYTYPRTKHWFFEENRSDAYDPSAAREAWKRTIKFLNEQLKT